MGGPVDLGQTYRYRHTVTDSAGVPANAGTVVITITLPDGTTSLPTVVNSGTGIYDIAYLTVQAGKHDLSGSATGGVLGAEFDVWEDAFTVEQPLRMFVGVDEASAHLRAAGIITTSSDREQLRWLCMAACDAVERDLGRVISRQTVVETYNGGVDWISLRTAPIISITSVTESGTAVAGSGYLLESNTGVLFRGSSTSLQSWAWGRQNIVVTYVVGHVNPPRAARMAALFLVQSLWQESQQASHPLLDEGGLGLQAVGLLSGLPQPLRNAYESLRSTGVA